MSDEMAKTAYDALDEKLSQDIRILKIDEISVISDYLIIASADNQNQIKAMLDNVLLKMSMAGYEAPKIEGNKNSTWILMDYKDVIVHIFSTEDRLFYDLERIWSDGKNINREDL